MKTKSYEVLLHLLLPRVHSNNGHLVQTKQHKSLLLSIRNSTSAQNDNCFFLLFGNFFQNKSMVGPKINES